jgi:hypothetical protein
MEKMACGRPTNEHGILICFVFASFQRDQEKYEGKRVTNYSELCRVFIKSHDMAKAIRSFTTFARCIQTSWREMKIRLIFGGFVKGLGGMFDRFQLFRRDTA